MSAEHKEGPDYEEIEEIAEDEEDEAEAVETATDQFDLPTPLQDYLGQCSDAATQLVSAEGVSIGVGYLVDFVDLDVTTMNAFMSRVPSGSLFKAGSYASEDAYLEALGEDLGNGLFVLGAVTALFIAWKIYKKYWAPVSDASALPEVDFDYIPDTEEENVAENQPYQTQWEQVRSRLFCT